MKTLTLIALLSAPLLLSNGCTIAPKSANPKTASFSPTPDPSGNHQTSGVWGWRTNGDLIIDGYGRDTYNTLISRGWGARLTPAVTNQDYGLDRYTNDPVESLKVGHGKMSKPVKNPGSLWDMNAAAQEAWPTMTQLSRQPVAPSRPP